MFGVHLTLARNYNFRKAGTRHRASTGITEDTDAIAIVVSEERGVISIAKSGQLERIKDESALRELLKKLTGENENIPRGFWHYFILSNAKTKIVAVTLSFMLWTVLVMQTGVVKKEFLVPLSFQLLPTTLEIDSKAGKTEISVILQGRSRDITAFDPTKLEVKVDAKNFATGTRSIEISADMISVPSYLSVIEIDPEDVTISIREKSEEKVEQEEKII
jgi:hypothetical protein